MQSHITPDFLASQGFYDEIVPNFFSKIRFTDSCWIWTARIQNKGYGMIADGRGRHRLAHRVSWMLHFGAIPHDRWVLHDCPGGDNRACVNPAHLWLGTASENAQDAIDKGRFVFPKIRQGSLNNRARFTEDLIGEIRDEFLSTQIKAWPLGRKYHMSKYGIWAILHCYTWRHCLRPGEEQALLAKLMK